MANTHSPTFKPADSPNLTVGRPFPAIFSTAMSLRLSVPTREAGNSRRSLNLTMISSAFATTWLLVMT